MRKVADYSALQELVRHHIDSFDHFIDSGLDAIISHIKPVRITDASTGTKLQNILRCNFFFLLFFDSC